MCMVVKTEKKNIMFLNRFYLAVFLHTMARRLGYGLIIRTRPLNIYVKRMTT